MLVKVLIATTRFHQSKWKKSVYQVYEDASLNQEWTKLIKQKCDGLILNILPVICFDSVDHVDKYVSLYKIGSGDITWTEIIKYIAKKKNEFY